MFCRPNCVRGWLDKYNMLIITTHIQLLRSPRTILLIDQIKNTASLNFPGQIKFCMCYINCKFATVVGQIWLLCSLCCRLQISQDSLLINP